MRRLPALGALNHSFHTALFIPRSSVAELLQVGQSGLALTFRNVDAFEVYPTEARVVNIKLLLERVALLPEHRIGLIDEHAHVEDERDSRNGHMRRGVVR